MQPKDYRARAAREAELFGNQVFIHDLPAAFHYWSHTWIRPKLEPFGFSSPVGMFGKYLAERCAAATAGGRFISIGAGNCDIEIGLAAELMERGFRGFSFECLELNETMLERGRAEAERRGLLAWMRFTAADFNTWTAAAPYDAVIANQSLHHVVELEHLFSAIHEALAPDGVLVVSDVIGRNGHQRWPEALAIVHEYWRRLPPSYRYNIPLRRYEEMYLNHACSDASFEGIRAQDILGLLVERFHFHLCIAFGNIIDPFVDRSFGFHFDMSSEWDRDFIREIHQRDESEFARGTIKPAHLLAVLGREPRGELLHHPPFTPEFCLRAPAPETHAVAPVDPYAWGSWPHGTQRELEKVCEWLRQAEDRVIEIDAAFERLNGLFEQRSGWAVQLDGELSAAIALSEERWEMVRERTAWAERLNAENETLAGHIRRLEREYRELSTQAAELTQRLHRLRWAERLHRKLS